MRKSLLIIFVSVFTTSSFAGTFTSNGTGGGTWNNSISWTFSGDTDGIPDGNDDITILNGDIITWGVSSSCLGLTINAGGTLRNTLGTATLIINGNYLNNGNESGSGFFSFSASGGSVDGAGTFSANARWSFFGNRTISATVTCTKNAWTRLYNGCTITNLGNITLQQLISQGIGVSNWINGTNSSVTLTHTGITANFDASSFINTVVWDLGGSSTSFLPTTFLNNTYHHLIIENSSIFCRLQANTIVNGNFTVLSGGDFDMNGFNLNVKGNFSNNQNFVQTVGTTITLDGTSAQTFQTNRNPFALQNLVINNPSGATIGGTGTFTIAESLTVQAGNLNLGTSKVTLLSTAAKTAYIGQSAGTISGTMTIQRFITARPDGYSDISSPMTSATFASWNDDFNLIFSAYIPNVTEPSCYGYDETIFDYYGIESMTENMVPGVGYEIYFASDGDSTTSLPARTVDVTGTPNMGNISVPVTVNNDGWNLVGNPYASFIDWTHYRTNAGIAINSQFLFYDEAIEDFAAGNPGDVLAPSQGFWIEATSAGNAIFQESNKIVNTSSSFRSRNEELFAVRVSSDLIRFTSNTYIRFDESADMSYIANHDLTFHQLPNAKAPSLFSHSSDGKNLRINELQPEESFSLPLTFISGIDGTYQISLQHIESAQLEGYNSIILEDKKTSEIIDITNLDYEFESLVDDDKDRFILHFNKKSTLAIAATSNVSFINSSDGVFVNFNLDELVPAYVTVYNLAGQEIVNTQLVAAEKNKYSIALPESFRGAYIIRVVVGNKIIEQFTQQYFK